MRKLLSEGTLVRTGFVALFLFTMQTASAVVYVKPNGTGDGTSWANACTLTDALAGRTEAAEIRLAQGVHVMASAQSIACAVTLRGGYAGVSESEEPTGDRMTTIITGDKTGNDTWRQYDPVTDTFTAITNAAGACLPIVADGKITVPKTEGRYAVAVPDGCSNDVGRFASYSSGGSLTAENLTFAGFGTYGTDNTQGAIVYHGADESTTLMTNCLFIACGNGRGLFATGASGTLAIRDCAFRNNLSNVYGSMVFLNKTTTNVSIENCQFEDLAARNDNGKVDGPVALNLVHFNSLTLTNCSFTRIVRALLAGSSDGSGGRGGLIAGFHSTSTKTVSGLVISNCYNRIAGGSVGLATYMMQNNTSLSMSDVLFADNVTDCQYGSSQAVGDNRGFVSLPLGGTMTRVNFVGNETVVRANCASLDVSDLLYSNGIHSNGKYFRHTLSACSFVSNKLTVVSDVLTSLTAAPFNCRTAGTFMNCTFFDNRLDVSGVTTDDPVVVRSRSILQVEREAATARYCPRIVCCTFAGLQEGDDVVVVGGEFGVPTEASYVRHSILHGATGDDAYTGIACDTANYLAVYDSIVRTKSDVVANVTLTDVSKDDPMLAYDADDRVLRPTVRVPGASGLKSVANVTPDTDQLGAARTKDALTCGSVEVAFSADPVVVVRGNPAVGGDIDVPSQTVSGEAQAVTATAADGFRFVRWKDADGNELSTEATYVPSASADLTVLTAEFASDLPTTWIFDAVAGKGVFGDGKTTTNIVGSAGTVVTPPEVAAQDNWAFTGWSPAVPAALGVDDQTFTAQYRPTFKVAYFDSHATGDGSGESWANAATDLATAFALAGTGVRGEVRVKVGKHVIAKGAVVTCGDVSLIGGFAGEGEVRTADRYATVLCGDVNGNDAYIRSTDSETVSVMGEGLAFNRPADNTADAYWKVDPTTLSDNAGYLLDYPATVDSSAVRIEGLTFTGFAHSEQKAAGVLTFGAKCLPTVTNCAFVANSATGYNSGNSSKTGSVIDNTVGGLFVDLDFIRNTGAPLASIGAVVNGTYTDIVRCRFSNGFVPAFATFGLFQVAKVSSRVDGCAFENNRANSAAFYGAAFGASGDYVVSRAVNTTFVSNIVVSGGRLMTASTVSNLVFRSNNVADKRTTADNPSANFVTTYTPPNGLLFENNTFTYDGQKDATMLPLSYDSSQWAREPLAFVGNVVRGGSQAALMTAGHVYGNFFVNTLFANNTIEAQDGGISAVVAVESGTRSIALCNATLSGNVADYDVYVPSSTGDAYLYNTIIWPTNRNAQVGGAATTRVYARNCCLKGVTADVLKGDSTNVWNDDPLLSDRLRRTESGFPYLPLTSASPYRKGRWGVPYYMSNVFVYRVSPTDNTGYAIFGSTKNYQARTLIDRDACGLVREEWKFRLGTVRDALAPGLMLLVR